MGVTSGEEQLARLDARERRIDSAIDRYSPYAGLAAGTVLTPFVIAPTLEFWSVTSGLVVVAAAWSWAFATHPVRDAGGGCGRTAVRAKEPLVGAIYVVGLLLLMALLVHRSPFYGFMTFAGYAHSFAFLRGNWRWLGVLATATAAAYSQLGASLADFTPGFVLGWAALTVLNSLIAGLFTYFGAFTGEQSERRRAMIAELNEANRRLSETLDENAALHARLLARAREAGILDERARMAREIHDTIAQGLTGVVTQLEAAGAAEDDAEVRRRHVDTARALARESLTEARRSVAALAPGRLADARLPDAVADMVKKWAETAGVGVVLDTTGDPYPLLPELEVTLFRVAQEALANVGRHAGASRAGLTLSYMDDVVVLDVRDDGAGFDPAAPREASNGSGFGLAAMEQRVRRVSGTFTVESAPGEGTAVSASVPAIAAAGAEP